MTIPSLMPSQPSDPAAACRRHFGASPHHPRVPANGERSKEHGGWWASGAGASRDKSRLLPFGPLLVRAWVRTSVGRLSGRRPLLGVGGAAGGQSLRVSESQRFLLTWHLLTTILARRPLATLADPQPQGTKDQQRMTAAVSLVATADSRRL